MVSNLTVTITVYYSKSYLKEKALMNSVSVLFIDIKMIFKKVKRFLKWAGLVVRDKKCIQHCSQKI
jgi:hypothetical protein